MDNLPHSQILLTYKGKVLLMNKSESVLDEGKQPWVIIGGTIGNKSKIEDALAKRVEKEAGIKINEIKQISENYYHCELTDDNVNHIDRAQGQLLDFFKLEEVEKLSLSSAARAFIEKYSSLI